MKYTLLYIIAFLAFATPKAMAQDNTAELVQMARERQAAEDAAGMFGYIDQALAVRSFAQPFSYQAWAEVVNLKAVAYSMQYDWQKAIKVGLDAYMALKGQPLDNLYAETVYNLATFYAGRAKAGDMSKAVRYALEARDYFNKKSRLYFACGNDLAYYYLLDESIREEDRMEKALAMAKNAVRNGEDIYQDDLPMLATILWSNAQSIAELEEYDMAIIYAQATLGAMERANNANTTEFVRRLIKLAGYYYQKRDFANEIATLERTAPIAKEIIGDKSREYVDCLRKLALAYNHHASALAKEKDKKLLAEAERCMQQYDHYESISREILIHTNRIDEIRVEQIPEVSNQALKFYNDGETAKAVDYEKVAATLNERYGNKFGLARSCSNLANFYHKLKDNANSMKYGQEAVDLFDEIDSVTIHKEVAYNNVALYFSENNRAQDAITYGLKAVRALEHLGDTISNIYAVALSNVSTYYHAVGDRENSDEYSEMSEIVKEKIQFKNDAKKLAELNKRLKKAHSKKKRAAIMAEENKNKSKESRYNANSVIFEWNRTVNASNNYDAKGLHDSYSKTLRIFREYIGYDYASKSVADRKKDWESGNWDNIFALPNTIAYTYSDNDSIVMDSYNAFLLAQGMPQFIQTGDTASISRTWQTVRNELPEGTAIVRFFNTQIAGEMDTYSAFMLRKEWSSPKVIAQLYSEKDFYSFNYENGSFAELMTSPEGRDQIMKDYRVGSFVWSVIFEKLLDATLSSSGTVAPLNTIRIHTVGFLNDINPTKMCLKPNQRMGYTFITE